MIQKTPNELKKHIRVFAKKEWESSFQQSTKCDSYRLFKAVPKMEIYLKHFKDMKYIKTLSKFRLSDHKLMIEEGRRARPQIKREDRICLECNSLEDEVHFLIDCDKYKNERERAFQAINEIYPTFNSIVESKDKFIFLMSQEDVKATRIIANFIHKSFLIR